MYAKQKGVQKVVKKGITRKRKDLSESKKPDSGNEKDDNKNKSITDAFTPQSGNEKQGVKKVGRKRKNDVKVSENVKKTKSLSESVSCVKESNPESRDTIIEGIKSDLPGMSLRRSRKTRQSGSSMSDKETDVITTSLNDPLKLEDGGRNSEREEQVENKFTTPSKKENLEKKKSRSIQDANEGKQMNVNKDIVNETQSVLKNSKKMKKVKDAAIKKSSLEEKIKEGDERPMTRHSTRSSQRTISKHSESISSGSERDFKSLEIPLMDTVSQGTQQRSKTVIQKLKENTDQTENLSSEQDTDIELQQNISNKGSEETVPCKVGVQKNNPKLPTTIKKRGRRKGKVNDSVPSIDNKTAEKTGLDTVSLNAGDKVFNKRKGKSKLNLPLVPKQIEDSFNEGNENTDTDFSIHAKMEKKHKKASASNDSLSKDSHNTAAMVEESEKISSDTNIDGICKSSNFISEDNDASISEEKGSEDKKTEVMVVRGRRGRKKLPLSRGRKFGYKAKNSSQVHPASDSEGNGLAPNDKGILEVSNQASVAPLIKTRTSRKRKIPPHSNEELGKKKLLKSSPSESSDIVQRVDSMSCVVPSSDNIPLKCDEISGGSDFELYLNKPDKAHQRKNKKTNLSQELLSKRTKTDLEKDELGTLDYSSSNVDSNDKCDSSVRRRVFKGKKRSGGVYKRKSRNVRLPSVDLAKRKVELTKKELYLGDFTGNFLYDISVVVDKLDLNDPEIRKLMSHSFPTNENARNMEGKTKEMDYSIDVDMDITAVDSIVPSTQTFKLTDESLEKEASVDVSTKNTDETSFLNTEKLLELSENKIPNLEVSVHTENTLTHCEDQESENTQTDRHKILDMDQDKLSNIMESENSNPSEGGIQEKQKELENTSNSLDYDTTNTCDENQLDAEVSINPLEKTTDNKNDLLLKQPISTNKNKISSESLEYSCDGSRTSIEEEEDKTSDSTEINRNVTKTETDSKGLIETEDVFIVLNSSEISKDSMHSETVLLSVKQDKMKECYVNMSDAIDICNTFECKKNTNSICENTDSESKICFNSPVITAQNNPLDIIDPEDTNATIEVVHEGQKSEKELLVNTAIEDVGEVTDSGLEDEIVAALEDNREVNDELEEVREVYIAAIKEIKEITGCGIDDVAVQDIDREVSDAELEDKNDNVLEDQSKAAQKEQPLVQSDMTIKDGKEIEINKLKSGKEVGYDVIKDTSGNAFGKEIDTLEEVNEKALEETVESDTTLDKINVLKSRKDVGYDIMKDESENSFEKEIDTLEEASEKTLEQTVKSDITLDEINELKSGKEVVYDVINDENEIAFEKEIDALEEVSEKAHEETVNSDAVLEEQGKSDAALEQIAGVKELDKSDVVLKLCKTKCDVTSLKDEKNADNDKNFEDLEEDVRDVNLVHEGECVATEKEGETALEGRTKVDLDTALLDEEKNKKIEQSKTHETLKAQLKSKITAIYKPQHINGNTETKEHNKSKNAADESQNEICAILEHQSKVENDALSDTICEPDAENENPPDFTESAMFKKLQKYFVLERLPSNFLSAMQSDMQLLHSEPNSRGSIDFNEDDCNKYFVDAGKKDQCVDSSLKLNKSKIVESPKVPIEQNSDNFENNQSKPGSSNTKVKTGKKRKIDEVEPKTYYWPKFSNQRAWEYLQPFVPVLHSAIDSILENKPRDPIQYFAQWLNDHKAEAYFMMASMPLSPEFKLKKPKR